MAITQTQSKQELEGYVLDAVCARPNWIHLHPNLTTDQFLFEKDDAAIIFVQAQESADPLIEFSERVLRNNIGAEQTFVAYVDALIESTHKHKARQLVADTMTEWDKLSMSDVVSRLSDIHATSRTKIVSLSDAMRQSIEMAEQKIEIHDVRWTIPNIDKNGRGLGPGELAILAGRPGTFKTALALQSAIDAARNGLKPGIWELEMSERELGGRALVNQTSVDGSLYLKGDDRVLEIVKAKMAELDELDIDIYPEMKNVRQIVQEIISAYYMRGLRYAIVDFLQMISYDDSKPRNQEIGDAVYALKNVAKRLDIPVLVLSQLSRDVDKRMSPPTNSDLADSGSIERAADQIVMLWRKKYQKAAEPGSNKKAEWKLMERAIVTKARHGPANYQQRIVFEGETYSVFQDDAHFRAKRKAKEETDDIEATIPDEADSTGN